MRVLFVILEPCRIRGLDQAEQRQDAGEPFSADFRSESIRQTPDISQQTLHLTYNKGVRQPPTPILHVRSRTKHSLDMHLPPARPAPRAGSPRTATAPVFCSCGVGAVLA